MFKRAQKKSDPAPAENENDPEAVLRDEFGLHHLWYLELRLRDELARSERGRHEFSLIAWHLRLLPGEALDADSLTKAGDLTTRTLRPYDVIARIDDQRVVALLPDAGEKAASTVAHRLKGQLQLATRSAARWQAGSATFPQDGDTGDALIQTALARLEEHARLSAA